MSDSGESDTARRTARIHNGWALFWFANIPPVVASYFVLGREAWESSHASLPRGRLDLGQRCYSLVQQAGS